MKDSTKLNDSDRRFLKGVNPRAFLDDWEEWHALVVGFSEVLCPWPARHKPSQENRKDIEDEYHYYMWGRTLGISAWLIIITTTKALLF
jgi:hypothetical protein